MRIGGFLEHELELLKEELHLDPLEERTWECKRLLVVDDSNESVVFDAPTNVQVQPHTDGTADLVAARDFDGRHPSLVNAAVTVLWSNFSRYIGDELPAGPVCRGKDKDGNAFTWYINGAVKAYQTRAAQDADPSAGDEPTEAVG